MPVAGTVDGATHAVCGGFEVVGNAHSMHDGLPGFGAMNLFAQVLQPVAPPMENVPAGHSWQESEPEFG
jgi:hypothetical protein